MSGKEVHKEAHTALAILGFIATILSLVALIESRAQIKGGSWECVNWTETISSYDYNDFSCTDKEVSWNVSEIYFFNDEYAIVYVSENAPYSQVSFQQGKFTAEDVLSYEKQCNGKFDFNKTPVINRSCNKEALVRTPR